MSLLIYIVLSLMDRLLEECKVITATIEPEEDTEAEEIVPSYLSRTSNILDTMNNGLQGYAGNHALI